MSGNDVLSQDEIDALLHGVDSGAVATETAQEDGEARSYDFANQVRIVRGRMPTLEMINERFARLFRISLFNLLRRTPEVAVAPVKMLKFSEYVHSLHVPTNLNLVRILPLRGTGLVVLDPKNGHVRYANAGHNPPYLRTSQGVVELRATGIPLGLFPDLEYEEKEAYLEDGDSLLMYSDGLVEAHNPEREMFGFPRLRDLLAKLPQDQRVVGNYLIELLMRELETFTRPGWEQEDDITMITLTRTC